jgi:hypothetical protein
LWNDELKIEFDNFKWIVEENGFVYSSISSMPIKSKYSDIPIRPNVIVYTPAIDDSFKDNWITCDLLIESDKLGCYYSDKSDNSIFDLIKKLTFEMYKEFKQTGVYFTDEAQDNQDFNGIRCNDSSVLWQFDYALIPLSMEKLYSKLPKSHKMIRFDNYIECWDIKRWK